ncbi:MAG TPA: ribonuclease HII [Methanoregulaceae archaeon]|nr:ribonuclease HII [Methanoregulaceae archaeon]
MFCGVDEAGKGAVLGPMVVAAVGCRDNEDLAPIGVKDSKKLAPAKREQLYEELTRTFPFAVRVIAPSEIDATRRFVTMNVLLARLHAEVITDLAPDYAYVDACDVIASRYGIMVSNFLGVNCRVIARHHADETVPAVSAASIVAKVTRDRELALLAEKFGEIGSGYPSDPVTVRYLREYIMDKGKSPVIARKSWETVCTIIAEKEQQHLSDFS